MGSSMGKTTLREIRQSLGRYFAIMAIVALGVGLFSGLKVTRDVMVSSAQLYFDQTSFYDVELLSTVGFETDAARQLSRREGVLDAQGSVSTDALLVDESGNENALQVMQLLDEQNQPVLVSGRLPQSAQECVVDALAFGEDSIGATLTLSDNNDDDTDEMFAQKTFRIVGRVNSPVYANYERGTTSLGNGTIDGFMLVLRDAFDCDYDTEIYVKLNTFGAQIYTDGYDNQIDEAEEWLEDFAQEQADERYSRLKSEAERDLFEGREQLTAQTQSGELELIASKDQLDSAKVEIDSGYAQLESGRTELQSGKAQLESQRQSLQSQKTELLLQKQQVLSGLNEVAAAKAQTAGTAYYSQSVAQEQQLQASLSQIESGLAEIESGLAQIEQQSQELVTGRLATVDDRREQQFLLEFSTSGKTQSLLTLTPKYIYSTLRTDLTMSYDTGSADLYYVYGKGKLIAILSSPAEAVQLADENVGVVLNSSQSYVWERGNRQQGMRLDETTMPSGFQSASLDENVLKESLGDDYELLNLTGCTREEILYMISSGYGVVVKTGANESLLLTGYDIFGNSWLYNPATGETTALSDDDSDALFAQNGNVFISYIKKVKIE